MVRPETMKPSARPNSTRQANAAGLRSAASALKAGTQLKSDTDERSVKKTVAATLKDPKEAAPAPAAKETNRVPIAATSTKVGAGSSWAAIASINARKATPAPVVPEAKHTEKSSPPPTPPSGPLHDEAEPKAEEKPHAEPERKADPTPAPPPQPAKEKSRRTAQKKSAAQPAATAKSTKPVAKFQSQSEKVLIVEKRAAQPSSAAKGNSEFAAQKESVVLPKNLPNVTTPCSFYSSGPSAPTPVTAAAPTPPTGKAPTPMASPLKPNDSLSAPIAALPESSEHPQQQQAPPPPPPQQQQQQQQQPQNDFAVLDSPGASWADMTSPTQRPDETPSGMNGVTPKTGPVPQNAMSMPMGKGGKGYPQQNWRTFQDDEANKQICDRSRWGAVAGSNAAPSSQQSYPVVPMPQGRTAFGSAISGMPDYRQEMYPPSMPNAFSTSRSSKFQSGGKAGAPPASTMQGGKKGAAAQGGMQGMHSGGVSFPPMNWYHQYQYPRQPWYYYWPYMYHQHDYGAYGEGKDYYSQQGGRPGWSYGDHSKLPMSSYGGYGPGAGHRGGYGYGGQGAGRAGPPPPGSSAPTN